VCVISSVDMISFMTKEINFAISINHND